MADEDVPNLTLRILQEFRAEMAELRTEMRAGFAEAAGEREDMRSEMKGIRSEMREGFAEASAERSELAAHISRLDARVARLDAEAARGFEGIQRQFDGHRQFVHERLADHEQRLKRLESRPPAP